MSQYDRTNTFIFSKNERKTQETHPDWTGSLNVNGVEFFMDAWIKTKKDGSGKFFAGKIKRKDKQPGAAAFERDVEKAFGEAGAKIDEEIPF
jgi:predicted ester cyclase